MGWRRSLAVLAAGAAFTVTGCSGPATDAGRASSPNPTSPKPTSTEPPPAPEPEAPPGREPAPPTLLVWVPGGLPAGFAERVAAVPAAGPVSVVRGDTISLEGVVPGFAVPVEAIALDCDTWAVFEPTHADAVCALGDRDVLLGATSARLRSASVGDLLAVAGGPRLRVAGVVPDDVVGSAELVVAATAAPAVGVRVPRYLLVAYEGDRASVESAIRAAAAGALLRVRAPGEVEWFRHADGVLPQAEVKARFGEFGSRPDGAGLTLDPGWRREHLVTVELPVVGRVTCHRRVVDALEGALTEIDAEGLVSTVDRSASGCWNPRPIAGTDQPSRHAWGIALDIVPAPTAPRVVEIFAAWGFTWGGEWLTPDPIHFEYVRPPARSPGGSSAR